MKTSKEYQKFDDAMTALLKSSHADLKAALNAEKAAKAEKRKAKKPSAVGRASRDKG